MAPHPLGPLLSAFVQFTLPPAALAVLPADFLSVVRAADAGGQRCALVAPRQRDDASPRLTAHPGKVLF